jgi:TPR repeat protein/tetratricopeptide (TPR) repeat protein
MQLSAALPSLIFLFVSCLPAQARQPVVPLESISLEDPLRSAVAAYADGEGDPNELPEQIRIFREAAGAAHPVALYYLGELHLYGRGLQLDPERAWHFFKLAAEQGIDRAYGRMGYMVHHGIGRDEDREAALSLYRIAARSDAQSMVNLARQIIEREAMGTEAYAIRAMEQAMKAGNAMAFNNLGYYHSFGRLTDSDPQYGVRLLEQAAEMGNSQAAANLRNIWRGRSTLIPGDPEKLEAVPDSRHLQEAQARKLIEQAVSVYRRAGIDAGLQKLEEQKDVWLRHNSIYRFRRQVWWEAQVLTGRADPEWSYRLFVWLYDACTRHFTPRGQNTRFFSPSMLSNIGNEQIVTGRIAELSETAETFLDGFLWEHEIDLKIKQREVLNKKKPKLPNLDALETTVLRQPGAPGARNKAGEPIYYADFAGMSVLQNSKYLQGRWREVLAHCRWVDDWIEAVLDAGLENFVGREREVWHIQAQQGRQEARVFRQLGFYEEALDRFAKTIETNSSNYRFAEVHEALTQQSQLKLMLGHELENGLKELKELRTKRENNKFEGIGNALETDLAIAAYLRSRGDHDAATALVEAVFAATSDQRLLTIRLSALKQRITWALEDQSTEGVAEDLIAALTLCREQGLKIDEPLLYHQYAKLKSIEGNPAAAIEMQLKAIDFYRSIDLYTWLPIRYLELSEWYLKSGNPNMAEYYRNLAISAIQMPGSEYPGWIVSKSISLADELLKSLAAFRGENGSDPSESGAGPTRNVGSKALTEFSDNQPGETPFISLQPKFTRVIPLPGQSGMGIFTLTNFGTNQQAVTLLASGRVERFQQVPEGQIELLLSGTAASGDASIEADLPANSQSLIYVTSPAGAAPLELELSVFTGADPLETVTLEYAEDSETNRTSVINPAYLEDNPFHMLSILHILQRAEGSSPGMTDLRFRASLPARIEGYDATGNLLFVDAEGDGFFHSPGDILRVDTNNDGFPDLQFGPSERAVAFELLILPAADAREAILEIQIETKDAAGWKIDAIDTIRRRQ